MKIIVGAACSIEDLEKIVNFHIKKHKAYLVTCIGPFAGSTSKLAGAKTVMCVIPVYEVSDDCEQFIFSNENEYERGKNAN